MLQVSNVAWNIGLNPYNYLQDCFGGAPEPNGIIHETATKAIMVLPDSVPMTKERAAQYLQVCV